MDHSQDKLEQIVDYTGKLAHLEISGEEKAEFCTQIGRILNFVEKLNELETRDIPPTAHILPVKNVTRPDTPTPSLARESFLNACPAHDGESLKVPHVIQET